MINLKFRINFEIVEMGLYIWGSYQSSMYEFPPTMLLVNLFMIFSQRYSSKLASKNTKFLINDIIVSNNTKIISLDYKFLKKLEIIFQLLIFYCIYI